MPEVQCRVLIAGYQENPGSDTWHHLGAERRCVPILWLALDVAASLFCPDNRSFSDRDLIHLGKPGELDRVYFQGSWTVAEANPRSWSTPWIKGIIWYVL